MAAGDFIPDVWATPMLKNWDEEFQARSVTNTEYEGAISAAGDTVHVQWFGDITAAAYAGTTTYQDVDENDDTMVIDQQTYFAFKVGDVTKVQAKPSMIEGYTKRANVSLRRFVEKFLTGATVYAAAGNTLDYTTGGLTKVTASNVYQMLVKARTLMEDDNTWIDNSMWMFVPPIILEMIRLSTELTHATEAGDDFIKGGKVRKLAGWNLLPISAANLTGSGTDGAPYKLIGGNKDFVHFAEQINKIESLRLESSFHDGVRGLLVYGDKVFDQNADCGICIDVEV
jgi:hypothetical protein